MQNNVYDTGNQLEREIRALPAYQAVKEAVVAVKADAEAFDLFNKFQGMTKDLQSNEASLSDESYLEQVQALYQQVQENELIRQLMEKEHALNIVIQDIQNMISRPLVDLYQELDG